MQSTLALSILGSLLPLAATAAQSQTLVVDPGNPSAYQEIQAAVNAASTGDRIRVHTGTYGPVMVMTDNLTIEPAHEHAHPVVDANGHFGVYIMMASGVTVRGLAVHNATHAMHGMAFAVENGNNNRLIDCDATHSTLGFWVSARNTVVQRCHVMHITNTGITTAMGMMGPADDRTSILNCTIMGCPVGIMAMGTNGRILGNTIMGCGTGVSDMMTSGSVYIGNSSHMNSGDGFSFMMGTTNVTLLANQSSYNGGDGFDFMDMMGSVTRVHCVANAATNNGGNGLVIDGVQLGRWVATKSWNNGGYGIYLNGGSNLHFWGSRLLGNTLGGSNVTLP